MAHDDDDFILLLVLYKLVLDFLRHFSISFIYSQNRSGPEHDPCVDIITWVI